MAGVKLTRQKNYGQCDEPTRKGSPRPLRRRGHHGLRAAAKPAVGDFSVLRAFAGIVVKKMIEAGESVAPIPPGVNISTSSGAVVAIADMNSLEAEVDVNEANVAQLQSGQPAEITVQAIPNHTYKGVLRRYIEVQALGPWGFADACLELFRRASITDAMIERHGDPRIFSRKEHFLDPQIILPDEIR